MSQYGNVRQSVCQRRPRQPSYSISCARRVTIAFGVEWTGHDRGGYSVHIDKCVFKCHHECLLCRTANGDYCNSTGDKTSDQLLTDITSNNMGVDERCLLDTPRHVDIYANDDDPIDRNCWRCKGCDDFYTLFAAGNRPMYGYEAGAISQDLWEFALTRCNMP